MIILTLIAWREEKVVHIFHQPYLLCVLKDTYLVDLLNVILYVPEVLIEYIKMLHSHLFPKLEPWFLFGFPAAHHPKDLIPI